MNSEQSKYPEGALKKLLELRWQHDVVARWLDCTQITAESRAELKEMLFQVDSELLALELECCTQVNAHMKLAG